ncbi:hypothetical protein KC878_02095 [Candidatus Saccharibacteria bacterium]|nr:hypothetical protein [Candidatus Saccharibacteria bacterium]MCB9820939.1 hypothetical protein [Candidatus Nomurabacteria bacterium]
MEIGNWYVNPELQLEEIERRRRAAHEWATSIHKVVEKTNDVEAQDLLNGVLSGIAVGLPDPERHLIPVQGPEQPTVVLVPLFADDADINDTTRLIMNPNSSQAARYTENRPGRIYFNAEIELSPLLKGILMLHEAKHAEIYEANRFREGTELDHWHEEVATFEFEFRLLQELCGKQYKDLMEKEVQRFIEEYDDKDGRGGTLPEPRSIDMTVVDEVFGVINSERERHLRNSIVWMDITFRMFDKIYPDTSGRDKAKFLRQLYTQ